MDSQNATYYFDEFIPTKHIKEFAQFCIIFYHFDEFFPANILMDSQNITCYFDEFIPTKHINGVAQFWIIFYHFDEFIPAEHFNGFAEYLEILDYILLLL